MSWNVHDRQRPEGRPRPTLDMTFTWSVDDQRLGAGRDGRSNGEARSGRRNHNHPERHHLTPRVWARTPPPTCATASPTAPPSRPSVGIDDEVGTIGSVTFEVYADATKVYDSGAMTGATATKLVDVSIAGAAPASARGDQRRRRRDVRPRRLGGSPDRVLSSLAARNSGRSADTSDILAAPGEVAEWLKAAPC